MKTLLVTTLLSVAATAAFGAASVRTPQLGGATVTPAATTNTARAGTMRAQTMKTSSVSTPASVTTTQSIATPVSTETTDARIALLKGIKGFSPNKIKETSANAQQELNAIDSRIEELQAQLDRAEAAQSNVITSANLEAKIAEQVTNKGLVTREELLNALPDLRYELQNSYSKNIDGKSYSCGMWQITIEDWREVLSRFIRPELCESYNRTFGIDCILDGEPKDLSRENTMWKWRFKVCRLDDTIPPIPEYQTHLVSQYYTQVQNADSVCYKWRITLSNWNDIVERFIIPEICEPNSRTYDTDCLVTRHYLLGNTNSIYRTQFDVCMPYTSPVIEHFNTIDVYNPSHVTEGFTILTNASDARIDDVYVRSFCGHESNYWCGKYSIEGEYNYESPQDRTLKMYRRLEGLYMTQQTVGQSDGNTWLVQKYVTNEPSENATKAEVAEHVREQVCGDMEANECLVPEADVYINQTTLWAKPRYEVGVYIQIPSPYPTYIETIGIENPYIVTQGITIRTNAADDQIDSSVIPEICGHESNYWCGKYGDIEGELDPDNPQQGRILKVQKRLSGFHTTNQYTVHETNGNIWDCKTYWTNDPGENNNSAAAATYVRTQVCAGREPDECIVTNSVVNATQWAKPRYQVEMCSLVNNQLPVIQEY